MSQAPRLLVVDDEQAVCEGCRRIFAAQGFLVDNTTDPIEGLELALKKDYALVLLDIRMPAMDGIEFLRRLRTEKRNLPVLLITGYPSFSTAQSAVRLGAADYLTKPFTPEELVQAVGRLVDIPGRPARDMLRQQRPWHPAARDARFFGESWWAPLEADAVCVGTVWPSALMPIVNGIKLPAVGDRVFRGLPFVGLLSYGKYVRLAPAPLCGVVAAVNQALATDMSALWEDPLETGWIARVRPTALEIDRLRSRPRRVILASGDTSSAQRQIAMLASLGCEVYRANDWSELSSLLLDQSCGMLLVDAASLGDAGLELVTCAQRTAPTVKTVVIGSSAETERAYRQHGIFYYAIDPLADMEILDILDAVFCSPVDWPDQPSHAPNHQLVTTMIAADSHGRQCALVLSGGALAPRDGLGWYIRNELHKRMSALKTDSQPGAITPQRLIALAGTCERLLVVIARELGRLPGTLVVDQQHQRFSLPPEIAGRATAIVIQPGSAGRGLASFDHRTASALAEHIADLLSEPVLHR